MKNRPNIIKRFRDKYVLIPANKKQFNIYLFIAYIILGLAGLMILFSASAYLTIKFDTGQYAFITRQGIFLFLGIIIMIIGSRVHYSFYYDKAYILYGLTIILLVLCYVPGISVPINGAKRAINLGITFMPSDIAKFTALIALARFINDYKDKMKDPVNGLLKVGLIIGIPFALVLLQTDLSTSLVILGSLGIVYLVTGFEKKYRPVLLVLLVLFVLFFIFGLKQYQRDRFTAFLNPEGHYGDLSWQVLNSLFAVSRGGVGGQGYGKAIYKYGYLATEVNNDMIFAVLAEELGFIGSIAFLALLGYITFTTIKIALNQKNFFAKSLALGLGLVYFIQSMINIGVAISIIPNTGITLPFVSNGGTSLLAFSMMFAIVLNISRTSQGQLDSNKRKNRRIRNNKKILNSNSL